MLTSPFLCFECRPKGYILRLEDIQPKPSAVSFGEEVMHDAGVLDEIEWADCVGPMQCVTVFT